MITSGSSRTAFWSASRSWGWVPISRCVTTHSCIVQALDRILDGDDVPRRLS
jgi:hypothetical protein